MPLVANHYRVIAVDLPGFGASTRWISDYGTKPHARYILALMDQLRIDRAHLFGFSMGSAVAFYMADLATNRVESISMYGGIGIQK